MRQHTMELTILSLLAMGICCVSGQRFGQLPSNATAMEGGSANFSCTVLSENSSTKVNSIWEIQAPGQFQKFLGENVRVNKTNLMDGSTAFIGKPFNSPLTIANINRSLDGTQVRCFFRKPNEVPMFQEMPYAFLTVQWLDVSEPNPPSEQLQVGQNITITVNISGNPVPCNWNASFVRGDGQDIPDKGNRVSIVNNTIIFRNLTEDDVGRYNITVSNGAIERVVFFELTSPPPTGALPATPPAGCGIGCIIVIVVVIIVLVIAAVVVVLLVRMCHKRRQKKRGGEKEDKKKSL